MQAKVQVDHERTHGASITLAWPVFSLDASKAITLAWQVFSLDTSQYLISPD
jgi:hypothetical protein